MAHQQDQAMNQQIGSIECSRNFTEISHSPLEIRKANLSTKTKPSTFFICPTLPTWEIVLCWTITIGTICYGFLALWTVSTKWRFLLTKYGSVQELPLIGQRAKDESDLLWNRWTKFMRQQYLPLLLCHSIMFNGLPKLLPNEQIWTSMYTLLSMLACVNIFTLRLVLFSLLQGCFSFACTMVFKHTITVWLSVLPLFYLLTKRIDLLGHDQFLVLLFIPYTLLSYISFCIELARTLNSLKTTNSTNLPSKSSTNSWLLLFKQMIFYVFYQPYLFALVVLYPDFECQFAKRNVQSRSWKMILWKALRVAFWWAMCELLLHFFYFGAISQNPAFTRSLPKDQFISVGIAIAAFFHMKYVVMFGLPAVFAMLDGMQPALGPICIFRIALFSKIWRGFDRGMHAFFKEYIYRPLGGSKFFLQTKIGLYATYFLNVLWHGMHHNKIVWILLNITELNIEFGAKAFYNFSYIRTTRERFISEQWFRRLLACLQIVPFFLGLFSNLYYLTGSGVGWQFVQRIIWEEAVHFKWTFLLICVLAYFHNQIVMEVEMHCPDSQNITFPCTSYAPEIEDLKKDE